MERKVVGDNAVFWIKVADDLSTNPVTIYIYYGKSDAITTSNFNNVFINQNDYFDDQTTGSIPAGFSTPLYGLFTISEEQAYYSTKSAKLIGSASGDAISDKNLPSAQTAIAIQYRCRKVETNKEGGLRRYRDSSARDIAAVTFLATGYIGWYKAGVGWQNIQTYSANTWYKIELRNFNWSAKTLDIYVDDVLKVSGATFINTSANNLYTYGVLSWSGGPTAGTYIDNIIVRKYVSPEPSHGSWGSEETLVVVIERFQEEGTDFRETKFGATWA
jgi:hypothetical protein